MLVIVVIVSNVIFISVAVLPNLSRHILSTAPNPVVCPNYNYTTEQRERGELSCLLILRPKYAATRQGEVTPIDSVQTPVTGVKNGVKHKAEKLEGKAVKSTLQIRKSQGSSTVKGQPDTKSHQSTIPHLVEQVQSRIKGLFEWR